MGQTEFANLFYMIRLIVFDACETLVFIALAVSLTTHTIRLTIDFARRKIAIRVRTHPDRKPEDLGQAAGVCTNPQTYPLRRKTAERRNGQSPAVNPP